MSTILIILIFYYSAVIPSTVGLWHSNLASVFLPPGLSFPFFCSRKHFAILLYRWGQKAILPMMCLLLKECGRFYCQFWRTWGVFGSFVLIFSPHSTEWLEPRSVLSLRFRLSLASYCSAVSLSEAAFCPGHISLGYYRLAQPIHILLYLTLTWPSLHS